MEEIVSALTRMEFYGGPSPELVVGGGGGCLFTTDDKVAKRKPANEKQRESRLMDAARQPHPPTAFWTAEGIIMIISSG